MEASSGIPWNGGSADLRSASRGRAEPALNDAVLSEAGATLASNDGPGRPGARPVRDFRNRAAVLVSLPETTVARPA